MPTKTDLPDSAKSRLPLSARSAADAEPPEPAVKPSEEEYEQMKREFSARFKEIFRGLTQAEIARRCATTDAVVKNYLEGTRFPTSELLIQIQRATSVNIHWLLTGEGWRYSQTETAYTDDEIDRIVRLAELHGRTFGEEVRALAMGALTLFENI